MNTFKLTFATHPRLSAEGDVALCIYIKAAEVVNKQHRLIEVYNKDYNVNFE